MSATMLVANASPVHKTLNNLQLLRAMAAIIVVIVHAVHEVSEALAKRGVDFAPPTIDGVFGVEMFFVISGFIIVLISYDRFQDRRYVPRFIAHRIVRIVPLYWLFTLLWLAVAMFMGGYLTEPDLNPGKILASFLFIPIEDTAKGYVPVYALGWSLNFEMLFYVIFTAALFMKRMHGLIFLSGIIMAIFVISRLVRLPVIEFYGVDYFLLEFLAGAWLAYVYRSVRWRLQASVLGPSLVFVGALVLLQIVAGMDASHAPATMVYRAVAAVTIVAGFVFTRDVVGRAPLSRLLISIGNSSYSLYLVHPFVLGALLMVAGKLGYWAEGSAWPLVLVCVAGSLAVGSLTRVLLEKPLLRLGQALVRGPEPRTQSAQAT